jgi:hypothetical protein
MMYEEEQIKRIAEEHMRRLINDEYEVATLPNSAKLYHRDKEFRDSCAMQEANANSRLFQATFED